jgi:hypothetical protein
VTDDALVAAWIAYQKNWWAYQALEKLIHERPMEALHIIENIAHRASDDLELLGMLAAGPLEDLLVTHGNMVIDKIEAIARSDLAMRKCLTGVWKSEMSDELHMRVQRAAEPNFKFPSP